MTAAPPNKPALVDLKAGRKYAWCSCGRSSKQPFCDGSHKGTDKLPVMFTAERDGDTLLCQCKATKSPPYCDGSHNNLDDGYELATTDEIEATKDAKKISRSDDTQTISILDGGAFAMTPTRNSSNENSLEINSLINTTNGATNLHVFELIAAGETPPHTHFGGDVVFYLASGAGDIQISGSRATIDEETGICVKRGEAFKLHPSKMMHLIAAVSPTGGDFEIANAMGTTPVSIKKRMVSVDPSKRQAMADRFYQELVDDKSGADNMTQFIGEVPRSRAAFHRHLYEEAIYIISGAGTLWTRGAQTNVCAGDILYLPARQEHSLECTSDDGLRLMGVFYPSGSPAINY